MALFVGLMSGTSLDGVDGVLADWSGPQPQVLAHAHEAFGPNARLELLALNTAGHNELHRAALAANEISRRYAEVVQRLLQTTGLTAKDVSAIGAHGQTVRHQPQAFDGTGYTWQLINGALLAELTGIGTVCDLRSRDVAAGGQGAPLVPAFHASLFGCPGQHVAVLNIGGIANLTLLPADGRITGFDCGPGNALMDGWCERHTGQAFDEGGRWAATGRIDVALLQRLLEEPFFAKAPPKSTGRDLLHLPWLEQALRSEHAERVGQAGLPSAWAPQDVQATLAELTACCAATDLRRHAPLTTRLLVCGGGAFNQHLMERLAQCLPGVTVSTTDRHGVPPDQVEALAFAWLARAYVAGLPGNLPAVTGARGPRVLGAWYPG
ncbi:MAG: anhydro-N-acetylmuramic acid kinase [Betaproteobacteria bacterium]|jgi:anhydro-N-acetylmuramic acid kinase